MNRPQLGDYLEIRKLAYKVHEGIKTTWQSYDAPQPGKAMYIGYRKVFNGTYDTIWERESWEYPAYEIGKYFVKSETVEVWVFVWNERMNPIYVFPQDTDFNQESENES